MIIGLTGGIGSGKSTVLKMFSKFKNIATYIADTEAKQLMSTSIEIKSKLIKAFGNEVYNENSLNKKFLANIVFTNKEKLAILNSIVHPVVHNHFKSFIQENKHCDYIVYENAILFENGSNQLCDKIITVTAPIEERINRVIKRDNVTRQEVLNRINNQWSDEKKLLQSHFIITNTSLSKTEEQILNIHNYLTKNKAQNQNLLT